MNTILSERTIAKIQDILMEQLGVRREQVVPEADILMDLGSDSLDMAEIAMTVEETFNVSIPDEEMENVHTVADLHEALASLLERTGQPV